jgi:hypothetical protein
MAVTKFALSELKVAEQTWQTTMQYIIQNPTLKA